MAEYSSLLVVERLHYGIGRRVNFSFAPCMMKGIFGMPLSVPMVNSWHRLIFLVQLPFVMQHSQHGKDKHVKSLIVTSLLPNGDYSFPTTSLIRGCVLSLRNRPVRYSEHGSPLNRKNQPHFNSRSR